MVIFAQQNSVQQYLWNVICLLSCTMIGFRCRRGNKYMSDMHDDVYEDIYILRAISCGSWNMKDAKYSKMISKYSRRRSHLLTKDFWVTSKSVTWWKLWLIKRIWTISHQYWKQREIWPSQREMCHRGWHMGTTHPFAISLSPVENVCKCTRELKKIET